MMIPPFGPIRVSLFHILELLKSGGIRRLFSELRHLVIMYGQEARLSVEVEKTRRWTIRIVNVTTGEVLTPHSSTLRKLRLSQNMAHAFLQDHQKEAGVLPGSLEWRIIAVPY